MIILICLKADGDDIKDDPLKLDVISDQYVEDNISSDLVNNKKHLSATVRLLRAEIHGQQVKIEESVQQNSRFKVSVTVSQCHSVGPYRHHLLN